ncbi:urease accessory protein UreF [Pseudomonas aeruginosa VRFPA09]|nr:urease accessory protein UreF [Pseudomonas aeruginosa VRFPA09]
MPARRSLTLYAALLFAAVAALVVSAVGFYLYRSVEEAMLRRSDVMVAGRVEHFRNLLRDNLTLAELKARPRLFENMLGNEQDILLLGQPGEAPIVAVNPRHERLPSLRVVAAGQALNPSVVHAALTHDGIPMRVLAAEVLVGGREPLQITAAHLLLGETRMLAQYRDRVIAAVLLAFLGTALLGWLVLRHGLPSERHRASRETRELAQESRQMGFSLHQLLEALPELDAPGRAWLARQDPPNLAAAWAMAARAWRLDAEEALSAWFWSWLENQLAVLMKTLPLGQLAAQKLASSLLPELDRACAEALRRPAVEGSAAFGLALASMTHETQYSRLFRS